MSQKPDDLQFCPEAILSWFKEVRSTPYILVKIEKDAIPKWDDALCAIFRRCYVADSILAERMKKTSQSSSVLISAKLPDAGSVMAGDFGEILAYLFQSCDALPLHAVGPKKWRLKQDRKKPAPYSDVVHFVLPDWPKPSTHDKLLCAEIKTKATKSSFKPIENAIRGCETDRTGRLANTLAWLRERALYEDLGDVEIDEINRFLRPDQNPSYESEYRAIVIICSSLLDNELLNAPTSESKDYSVVIISVPDLKKTYSDLYESMLSLPAINKEDVVNYESNS